MDQEHPSRLSNRLAGVVFDPEYLTRRDKEHDPLIKIVVLLAVPEFAAEVTFHGNVVIVEYQAHGFFSLLMLDVLDIDHADERVLGFRQLPEGMKFGDAFYAVDLVHDCHFVRGWRRYQATSPSLRNFPVGPSGPMVAYFTM